MERVLDFTRVLAGPWATQILGDQGFDVVKVEAPEGDETRTFLPYRDGMSVYFACTNRNKRSIVLDLKQPEGQALARRLARTADVVVENFRPGVMERLGLGGLEEENPRLIQVSISAFGEGPLAERAGYDLVLQSMGGIATLTGDPPQKAGPSIADLASAMVAVQAVLFALLERHRTGKGKRVSVRMFDVQHALLAYYASSWLNAGKEPPAPSNQHPSISPYNLYPCADGWLAVACANEPLFRRLAQVVGIPDDPRFATNADRVAHREALDALLIAAFSTDRVELWEQRLAAAGVPCGPALSVPASLSHPAARQVHLGAWTFPAPPLDPVQLRPPPRLGEHTEELLEELGLGPAERGRLRAAGVLGR
ncbi:MAG TPA: CoA transferase [Myxococcota bacterium]|nr:CoA transferase [Myxococcota bacterium]